MSECPQESCRCESWPPEECPQCGIRLIGGTLEDWWRHFEDDCDPLGRLYCFASKPDTDQATVG